MGRCAAHAAVLFVLLVSRSSDFVVAASPPNILIIVADDLGWGDVGWHGSHIKTPHLDTLVRTGVELDRHYVSPMCSPTRAAILSGRYASRFGVTGAQNDLALFSDTVTLARGLREAGYATAITGEKVELFNLAKDPHEKQDFGAQEAARVESLQALLAKMAAADTAPRRTGVPKPAP